MRRFLMRRVGLGIAAIGTGLWLPLMVACVWIVTNRVDLVVEFLRQPAWTRGWQTVVVVGLFLTCSAVLGLLVALRIMASLSAWVADLGSMAERFGEAKIEPLRTGVPEIDRVGDIIARGSAQVTRSLTAERAFASDASHQLRTPLTALLMRLEEIAATDDMDVAKEEAAVAIAQVDRLTRVVDDLLMRRRSDPQAATPEVSLDSVIASLQREWQPAFEQARRSVRVHGERGLTVKATPVALSQVFSTLLENSLVHGRGTVDIHMRRSGPSVVVEVRDEGDGVPAAMAPHIFERAVSSGRGSSTGLGLALARDLAESCGGRLDLIERTPATFALFLSEAVTNGPVR
ncbi:MAG: HAMP domain-containing sensor histidine kinase [Dermatophilaceae bacterium]